MMQTTYNRMASGIGMLDYAPYSTFQQPSNTIGIKPPVYGRFKLEPATWQQPNTPPPRPQAGLKGILPDAPSASVPSRKVQYFTPAENYQFGQSF